MYLQNIHQAKTHLSKLIEQTLVGEEVMICKAGKPLVKLVPCEKKPAKRTAGLWKGQVHIMDDFEQLPEAIQKAFAGKAD